MFKDKRILITGASGTVGKELTRQLLTSSRFKMSEVVCADNNESELFFLEQNHLEDPRFSSYYVDIRDYGRVSQITRGIDVIFHTAALKHVVICERSPFDAVQTNILGVQNIVRAAHENDVEKVIFTSTDKAVNPTNVMGTSKLMGERLITAANTMSKDGGPVFSSTRFGNVLGSRGSVLPIFAGQIAEGGPVTLTDADMTRFIMSIEEAVSLIINSSELMQGGEVFVTKMPVVNIADLAQVMIDALAPDFGFDPKDIAIRIIGSKPGEKLYEELMSNEETRRAKELKNYFAVTPAFKGFYSNTDFEYEDESPEPVTNAYNSSVETALTQEQILKFLMDNKLLARDGSETSDKNMRYWPGDKEEQST